MYDIDEMVDLVFNSNKKIFFYKGKQGVYIMFPDHYWGGYSEEANYAYITNYIGDINGFNERGLCKQRARNMLSGLDYDRVEVYSTSL